MCCCISPHWNPLKPRSIRICYNAPLLQTSVPVCPASVDITSSFLTIQVQTQLLLPSFTSKFRPHPPNMSSYLYFSLQFVLHMETIIIVEYFINLFNKYVPIAHYVPTLTRCDIPGREKQMSKTSSCHTSLQNSFISYCLKDKCKTLSVGCQKSFSIFIPHTCTPMHTYAHTWMHIQTYTCAHLHIQICTDACTPMYAHRYTRAGIQLYFLTYTCINIHLHTNACIGHICTYKHTHSYLHLTF